MLKEISIIILGSSSNKRNTEANVIEVEVDQVEVPPGEFYLKYHSVDSSTAGKRQRVRLFEGFVGSTLKKC